MHPLPSSWIANVAHAEYYWGELAGPPSAEFMRTSESPPSDALKFEVFVGSPEAMQPTSTLIYGTERAILVDAQFIRRDARRLVHTIQQKKLRLHSIYITHAHPDRYFGLEVMCEAFPDAIVMSAPEVVRRIDTTSAHALAEWWPRLQKHLPDVIPAVHPMDDETFTLEGQVIRILHIDQGDVGDSTMLHIPSHHTIVAGDMVAHGTHLWLAETNGEQRMQWLRNLEAMKGLGAKTVIPGHKGIDNLHDHASMVIGTTQGYLRDFDAALDAASSPDDVVQFMMERHGAREIPWFLEQSAMPTFHAHIRDRQEALATKLSESLPRFRPPAPPLPRRAPFTPPRFKE